MASSKNQHCIALGLLSVDGIIRFTMESQAILKPQLSADLDYPLTSAIRWPQLSADLGYPLTSAIRWKCIALYILLSLSNDLLSHRKRSTGRGCYNYLPLSPTLESTLHLVLNITTIVVLAYHPSTDIIYLSSLITSSPCRLETVHVV